LIVITSVFAHAEVLSIIESIEVINFPTGVAWVNNPFYSWVINL